MLRPRVRFQIWARVHVKRLVLLMKYCVGRVSGRGSQTTKVGWTFPTRSEDSTSAFLLRPFLSRLIPLKLLSHEGSQRETRGTQRILAPLIAGGVTAWLHDFSWNIEILLFWYCLTFGSSVRSPRPNHHRFSILGVKPLPHPQAQLLQTYGSKLIKVTRLGLWGFWEMDLASLSLSLSLTNVLFRCIKSVHQHWL